MKTKLSNKSKNIIVIAAVLGFMIGGNVFNSLAKVYAVEICIFFCPEDNTKQLNAFIACMEDDWTRTKYGTEDLSSDGKMIPSKAEPGTMMDENQLKKEWSEHSDLYSGDCYKWADITPQKVESIYRESIGK